MNKFKSIYNHLPRYAVIDSSSEVKRDESLTISQIISLHLRGLPTNLHIYDDVKYEVGSPHYTDEKLEGDYYEMESDLSDFNLFVDSSYDSYNNQRATNREAVPERVENEPFAPNENGASEQIEQ